MSRLPSVYVVLVNWNGREDTVACVDTCRDLDYGNFRILIVDNGSTDGSAQILRQSFPDIELIETGNNLGFAGGNNVGIRHALEHAADYVWLLNNDTLVRPTSLSALVDAAEKNPSVGMAGSKIPFVHDPGLLWYAGGLLDEKQPYLTGHRGYGEEDRGQFDGGGETGYVTGCSLLARREMIERIGLLDETFFLYFEDADWNARAHRDGWKSFYCPDSVVLHKASASIGGGESPRMRYYLARNLLYFVRKNYPGSMRSALWFDLFENVLVMLKKGRVAAAASGLRGITDFLNGRIGQMESLRRS